MANGQIRITSNMRMAMKILGYSEVQVINAAKRGRGTQPIIVRVGAGMTARLPATLPGITAKVRTHHLALKTAQASILKAVGNSRKPTLRTQAKKFAKRRPRM
jgi:hypothetical protein